MLDWSIVPGGRVLAAETGPAFVRVPVARARMEAAGTWSALVAILTRPENASDFVKLLTLEYGLAPGDPKVRGLIAAAGDDPDRVLAP